MVLALPGDIAARVTGPTVLFYFSPTCPHCWAAMPEANALAAEGEMTWLGIAVGSSKPADLATFEADHVPRFDVVVDTERAFSQAVAARSTPSVYVVHPAPEGATPAPELPPRCRCQLREGGGPAPLPRSNCRRSSCLRR